jgi:hypothetical protein
VAYRLPRETFTGDWTLEETANLLFVESDYDFACHHVIPITAFKHGGCSGGFARARRFDPLGKTPSSSGSNTMNGYQSSARQLAERELHQQCVSDFHALLLGMAAHDLRQPLQVIQST